MATHGLDCRKISHVGYTGFLHDEHDDGPFDVDGMSYCGRCHRWMDSPASGVATSTVEPPPVQGQTIETWVAALRREAATCKSTADCTRAELYEAGRAAGLERAADILEFIIGPQIVEPLRVALANSRST